MEDRRRGGPGNIAQLLLSRETGGLRGRNLSVGQTPSETRCALGRWTENDFMRHCSGHYVEFKPVPRSTIASSFSPNGALLASTHGDHTVKIVDCFSGKCLKILEGHTRTPWVVRFHPLDSDILASGSLDHRVVVWRVSTGEKLYVHDFGKPIASIAFHPSGKALVVASGHKVYFWDYTKPASSSRPNSNPSHILRTKRSLRALHFHPLGLPLVLTAEVVDTKKTAGTTPGSAGIADAAALAAGSRAAAAAVADLAAAGPSHQAGARLGAAGMLGYAQQAPLNVAAPGPNLGFLGTALSDVAMRVLDLAGMRLPGTLQAVARALLQSPRTSRDVAPQPEVQGQAGASTRELASQALLASFRNHPTMWTPDVHTTSGNEWARQPQQQQQVQLRPQQHPPQPLLPWQQYHQQQVQQLQQQQQLLQQQMQQRQRSPLADGGPTALGLMGDPLGTPRSAPHIQQLLHQGQAVDADPLLASVPGQIAAVAAAAAAAMSAMERLRLTGPEDAGLAAAAAAMPLANLSGIPSNMGGTGGVDLAMCDPWGMQRIRNVGGSETHAFPLEPQPLGSSYDLAWGWQASGPSSVASGPDGVQAQRHNAMLETQLMPLATTSEQPCVVNLNVWSFNHRRPSSTLDKPRLSVPRAVLCSEMGAQFSPCGKYLALCVAVDAPSEAGRAWLTEHMRQCKQRMAMAEAVRDSAMGRYSGGASTSAAAFGHGNLAGGAAAAGSSWWAADLSHIGGGSRAMGQGATTSSWQPSGAAAGSSSGAEQAAWPFTPSQFRPTSTGFMVPYANAWEVFPNDVPWLEFKAGTPDSIVRDAVSRAREAARLNRPLYELRVYSLDGRTFGHVLQARLIRAAHCLTSVQFSPTSEHLLVAYGRRYISLCNLVAEGEGRSLVPAHTILEIYNAKTLQLVRALPSLDDEVNVATFHPVPGVGIVYGTKEGRLRMLRYDKHTPRRPCIPLATGGGRLDEELAAAERDDSNSDEDEPAQQHHQDLREQQQA